MPAPTSDPSATRTPVLEVAPQREQRRCPARSCWSGSARRAPRARPAASSSPQSGGRCARRRCAAHQAVPGVAVQVVLAVVEQAPDGGDLGEVLVDVGGEPGVRDVLERGRRTSRAGRRCRTARTAGSPRTGCGRCRASARRARAPRRRRARVSCSSSARSIRSLTTSPLVTRSPTRAASVEQRVDRGREMRAEHQRGGRARRRPARTTNSAATRGRVAESASRASSGSAYSSSHSSSGIPSAPMARTCGKCTCVSTSPGSSRPPSRSTTSSSGAAAHGGRRTRRGRRSTRPARVSRRRRRAEPRHANGLVGVSRTRAAVERHAADDRATRDRRSLALEASAAGRPRR